MTWGLKNLKNLHFNRLLLPKYIMFELKKYRGVIFHHNREWCKIWRKTDLWFGKWHEEFSPEYLKVSKLELLWGPFIQSRKCMSLKFTGELCVMAMKNDAKFEKKLTCHEFNKFWHVHSKILKICTLMGCFWPKYIMLELRTKSRLIKSLKEDWLALSKMTWEIWQIFVRALESLKIGTLMGCFYS